MTGWKMAINSAIPCLIILFFGSWSDRHNRRKPCILVPLFGEIMMAFALLLCVYFENTPIEMAIFVEVFFPSITGTIHIHITHTQFNGTKNVFFIYLFVSRAFQAVDSQ